MELSSKKSKAILVFAWRRPKYLYVCIDSLFRNDLDGWDVYVSIDGEGGREDDIRDLLRPFDTKPVHVRQIRLRNCLHITYAIKEIFEKGYEKILFIEDDFFLRSDTIKYVENARHDCFFISLVQGQLDREARRRERVEEGLNLDKRDKKIISAYKKGLPAEDILRRFGSSDICYKYTPRGNVVKKEDFEKLFNFIIRGKFLSNDEGSRDIIDVYYNKGHSVLFGEFLETSGNCTRHADASYVFHFGVSGEEFESRLLAGKCEEWVGNLVELIEECHPCISKEILLGHENFCDNIRLRSE